MNTIGILFALVPLLAFVYVIGGATIRLAKSYIMTVPFEGDDIPWVKTANAIKCPLPAMMIIMGALAVICSVVCYHLWPLAMIVVIAYGLLRFFRFSYRIKQSLSTLSKHAHDHPATVKKTKVKIDLPEF